jgi:hypothetical protein
MPMNVARVSMRTRCTALLLAVLSCAGIEIAQAQRSMHGVALPQFVHVPTLDAHLRLAGAAVVDRHYLPFQVVALYVGREAADAQLLASGLGRCRVEIHWLGPALDPAAASDWWQAQFARAQPDAAARLRLEDALRRVAASAGDAQRGSVLTIDYDPDAGLFVSRGDGQPARFAGLELARTVLAIWLGPGAGDTRAELVGTASAAPRNE